MKIYLAGPMRGIPDLNFPAFHAAAAQLRAVGHEVFNPAELTDTELRETFAFEIDWLIKNAEAVVLLSNWAQSKGARAEVAVAEAIGIPVKPMREMGVAW